MTRTLDDARRELQAAAQNQGGPVHEQLLSIDEGVMELGGGEKTEDAHVHVDRVAELEEKLDGLKSKTEGDTRQHIENAASALREVRERRESREESS